MEQTLDRRLMLRPLALPFEHGAWGFLLEPIVLGMLIAPSVAGLFVAIGVVAAFLVRHPLRLALQDRKRGARYPRTAVCEAFAASYALVALIAFSLAGIEPLVPLLAVAPLALIQVFLNGRSLAAETLGSLVAGASATAIVLAAHQPLTIALALWALVVARGIPSILYVRATLGRGNRAVMIAAHVAAVLLAIAIAPLPATFAMVVLLARAVPNASKLRAKEIGIREIAYGVLTVVLIAIGY